MLKNGSFVCESDSIKHAVAMARRVACLPVTVLITGETGTGKEVIAQLIHEQSKRAGQFVTVNCTAIPPDLLESELFGSKRGSFTGSSNDKIGLVATAEDGTLFLDEIGDMPVSQQAKILRLLETREYRAVGENAMRRANCRFVAATNLDIEDGVKTGKLRSDLKFRLNAFHIHLQPLRKRHEDLIPLTNLFIKQSADMAGQPPGKFKLSHEAHNYVMNYDWPGNVRELKHAVEKAVIMSSDGELNIADLDDKLIEDGSNLSVIDRKMRDTIIDALSRFGGNKLHTAQYLGIGRQTLYNKIKQFGLDHAGITEVNTAAHHAIAGKLGTRKKYGSPLPEVMPDLHKAVASDI